MSSKNKKRRPTIKARHVGGKDVQRRSGKTPASASRLDSQAQERLGKKSGSQRQGNATVSSAGPPPWQMEIPRGLSRAKAVAWVFMAVTFFWAYWPTIVQLVQAWDREPDYSHGFIVPALALLFLWVRRDRFPGLAPAVAWPGLLLIALSIALRLGGALVYVDAVDAWSMLLWLAGMAWLLGGYRVMLWSLPSIAFLWFMVPLPFRAEGMLSHPLQRVATKLSCWSLQVLGQPAIAEGNVILLGDHQLEVEQACSGLRIFMGIVALAFAYVIVVRRSWWEKALLLASTLPIALIANATRIVVTGLLYQHVSGEAAQRFTHDFSGYVMIPFAAGLFGLVLWYLGKLFPQVQQMGIRSVIRDDADGGPRDGGAPHINEAVSHSAG